MAIDKKPKRGPGRPRKVKDTSIEKAITVVEPDAIILPPAIRKTGPLVMQSCEVHSTVTYRIGGFCERCYGDQTMAAAKKIDDMLIEQVVDDMEKHVLRLLKTEDSAVLERFLGRVMARFARPSEAVVSGTVKHVHFAGPVDFGQRK